MGIHYDYKSTKGNKLMEKQAREKKSLQKKEQKEKLKKVQRLNKSQRRF